MSETSDRALQDEIEELRDRLGTAELENGELRDRVADLEQRCTSLATLCAATSRLHASRDRERVLTAIVEIVVNLLGCEEFAVLWSGAEGGASVVVSQGVEGSVWTEAARGDGAVGRAMRGGARFVAASPREPGADAGGLPVTACIPLLADDAVRGVLVLSRMLPQKKEFGRLDRGLFDLLAHDAARALQGAVPMARDVEP